MQVAALLGLDRIAASVSARFLKTSAALEAGAVKGLMQIANDVHDPEQIGRLLLLRRRRGRDAFKAELECLNGIEVCWVHVGRDLGKHRALNYPGIRLQGLFVQFVQGHAYWTVLDLYWKNPVVLGIFATI